MTRNFLKLSFIVLCLLIINTQKSVAQAKPAKDTLRVDSLIQDSKDAMMDNIPVVSIDENDMQDGSSGQNVSSQLTAGRDPFYNGASFHFNVVRFRFRGYDSDLFSTEMNGAPMENLDNGFTPYGLWGGLNDVMRNRETVLGLRATPHTYGEIGGSTAYDTRASHQRKQTSFNYALSNRNYMHRFMITHSTGMSRKGWALSLSGSRRWATEGYTDGTYYDGWSGFLGIDKKINARHLLSFVAFATPTENGRQGPALLEMVEITGNKFYNPYWGYQNGEKRNSSVAKSLQPLFIFTHDAKLSDKTQLTTALSAQVGQRSVSGIDWYHAADPRPDYYRYLPSYQTDPIQADLTWRAIQKDPGLSQINWDRFYQVNRANFDSITNVNGVAGNTVRGNRSLYVLENRITATDKFTFNSTINSALKDNIDFSGGISYQYQKNKYYKVLDDLLGGQFYGNVNQFAERDFASDPNAAQNDLNNPNRVIYEGDKFGYNYNIDIRKIGGWAQTVFKFNKVDFFIAGNVYNTSFWRTGNVKNGLFPNNSYGKSTKNNFLDYGAKGGVTLKINGRNYFFANATYQTRAPYFENAYLAPRTRDFVQDNLESEIITSGEGGYVLNAPKIKVRLTGYITDFKNGMNVLSFYHDDYRNFVNYAISNIGRRHYGGEFGVEAKLYKGLSVNAAAAVGRYYYNTRQQAIVTLDNSAQVLDKQTIYSDNFNVPTPQEAYTFGFDYRSPHFWFANVNFNYFREMWLDFNPLRRTYAAVEGLDNKSALFHQIIDQEQLKNQYTVDFFCGYSWRLNNDFKGFNKPTYLVFNFGINNLLNNQDIITGGYEQLRFDYQLRNVNKFPPKYFRAYGLNYFASVGLRF